MPVKEDIQKFIIRPYSKEDFPLLQLWITDRALLLQYSGTDFSFPITETQIMDYQIKHPDRKFYIALVNEKFPVAFGEIIPQDIHSVRIARILVGGEKNRGRGLGKLFVQALIKEAVRVFNVQSVDLWVFEGNKGAIRCYLKAGFNFVDESRIMKDAEKEYVIKKMTISV